MAGVGPAVVYPEFCELLAAHIQAAGKPRQQVSTLAAINHSYLIRILNGDRGRPAQPVVERLARALELTPIARQQLLASAGYWPADLSWRELLGEPVIPEAAEAPPKPPVVRVPWTYSPPRVQAFRISPLPSRPTDWRREPILANAAV